MDLLLGPDAKVARSRAPAQEGGIVLGQITHVSGAFLSVVSPEYGLVIRMGSSHHKIIWWAASRERTSTFAACVLLRASAYAGSGVTVHMAGNATGRVALTDIHDGPVQNVLAGLEAGAFVACRVLPGASLWPCSTVNAQTTLPLSIHPSACCWGGLLDIGYSLVTNVLHVSIPTLHAELPLCNLVMTARHAHLTRQHGWDRQHRRGWHPPLAVPQAIPGWQA